MEQEPSTPSAQPPSRHKSLAI